MLWQMLPPFTYIGGLMGQTLYFKMEPSIWEDSMASDFFE
jgi:hypothetical protein